MLPKPGVALQDVRFAEGPYIIHRGGGYYLHYRVAVDQSDELTLRMVVNAKKANDKGYYYFIAPISQPEKGNVVERPLAADGLTEFAQRRALYWLNPDRSEIPLEIKEVPE